MAIYGGTTEQRTRLQRQPNMPILPTKDDQILAYLAALDRAITDFYGRLAERLQTFIEIVDTTDFGAAVDEVTVTFGSAVADTDYIVLATPGWEATIWVTDLATSGFTLHASAAPGGGGSTVRWAVIR